MNLHELMNQLRRVLDDEGGHGVDYVTASDSQLKWTNEELTLYINLAEREAARRTRVLFDATTPAVVEIDLVVGEDEYDIHSSILTIERAKLDSQVSTLSLISYRDMDAIDPNWESLPQGTTKYVIRDWHRGKLKLSRPPDATDILRLRVYRLPKEDMNWTTKDSSCSELPEAMQIPMLHWAAHLAYFKDEPNTLDSTLADKHEAKFFKDFGPQTDFYSEERRKRTKRGISYGGIRQSRVGLRNRNGSNNDG